MKTEKQLLTQSVLFALMFAIVGIVVGIITQSYVIAFDGLYSIMSVMLSLFALVSYRFMSKHDWKRYPFGKTAVEPLVILVQNSILLMVLLFSVGGAIMTLASGGRMVDTSIALSYSTLSALGCLIITLYIHHQSKKVRSGMLKAETTHWMFDTIVSFGVLLTFVLISLMDHFNVWVSYIPLVDPFVVILMGLAFIKMPLVQVIEAIKEIIGIHEEGDVSSTIKSLIKRLEKEYIFKESFLRVSSGRQMIWIEIDFVVDETSPVQSIKDQDMIRERIDHALKSIKSDKWITVSFVGDRKWAL